MADILLAVLLLLAMLISCVSLVSGPGYRHGTRTRRGG